MWNLRLVAIDYFLDETTIELFDKYKYALAYIGIDFEREDIRNAIVECTCGMESAFQATIGYWFWTQDRERLLEYPNAFLIDALFDQWKPYNWKDEYLDDPRFKSPCQLWWEQAGERWGTELRNSLIADVSEDEWGYEKIVLVSGHTIPLTQAQKWDWEKVLDWCQRQVNFTNQQRHVAALYLAHNPERS